MKNKSSGKSDLNSLSKEELIREIENLRSVIRKMEYSDTSYRPTVTVDMDKNVVSQNPFLIDEILTGIDEVVYFARLNPDGSRTLRFLSRKIEETLGVSYDEYVNNPSGLVDRVHPDDMPGVFDTARKLREEKQKQTFVYRYMHPQQGKYIWIEEKIYPQIDSEGRYAANLGIYRNISSHKEGEYALAESRNVLEKVLNSIEEIVYYIDLTLPEPERIRFVSENIAQVFGISKEDFIAGKTSFLDHCHPDDVEKVRAAIKTATEQRQPVTLLYRFGNSTTEKYLWIEERIIPGFDEEGNQTEIFGVTRDVTEEVMNRNAVLENEKRFRILAQNANDIIYRLAFYPEPHYEFISPSVERVTGYSQEDYYNDPQIGDKTVHPEDQAYLNEAIRLMMENSSKIFGSDAQPLVFRLFRKDGSVVWTETSNRPVFDREGKVIAIEGISRDITQRKESEKQLLDSRESYRSLVEQHPDGIVITDEEGKIMFVNQSVLRVTRIESREEIIGKSVLSFLSPEQRIHSAERIRTVLNGGTVPFEIIQLLNPAGEIIELESRPLKYTYQGTPGMLIFLRDVSAERQLEKEQLKRVIAEDANKKLQKEVEERIRAEKELLSAQQNLRLLIDSSIDMICASDPEGFITEFNSAAQHTFGYSKDEIIGKHVTILYQKQDDRLQIMEKLLNSEGTFSGEVINRKKDGTVFTAFLSASVLRDAEGNVIGSMGVSRDISAIKKAETELRLREEKYRAIYNQAFIGIALVDKDTNRFIEVNQRLCDILGYSLEELRNISAGELRVKGELSRLPSGKEFIQRGFERVIDEQKYLTKTGEEVILNIAISLVKDAQGNPLHFVYVYEDITPKRKAEEQIMMQAAKMNAMFESSSHMIWTVDRDYKLLSFNTNQIRWLKEIYGIKPYVGMPMLSGKMVSSDEYNIYWKEKLDEAFEGKNLRFETSIRDKSGETRWREVYISPIRDQQDNIAEVACISHDISDQKAAEENIRQSLKEKEVLLKEVHHRVKNNLQVISSILNLQSSYVKDKKSLDLLLESQNRIKSMAFVHESLYQTKDFSNISFSEYVQNICNNLMHSYSDPSNPPELRTDLDPLHLNLDTAIPCGLIINELISNAFKYAFKGIKNGVLEVSVKEKGKQIVICIADNGKGLPPDLDFRNTESLGLQLVVTLVDQINGQIELDTKKGTKFTISFIPPHTNQ